MEKIRVLESIDYPKTGIMLDTGHLLNTNQAILTEEEGIRWILTWLSDLGELRRAIRGIHLSKSLSAEYVNRTRNQVYAGDIALSFWDRYHQALEHVRRIDQHEPFRDPAITCIFDIIDPRFVTYEFTYRCLDDWLSKIRRQRRAMAGVHPSKYADSVNKFMSKSEEF